MQWQCKGGMAVLGHILGAGAPAGTPIPTVELGRESLQPSHLQRRRKAAQTHSEALSDSIRQVGLIEPICVRPRPDGMSQIIAGECRWSATKLAGLWSSQQAPTSPPYCLTRGNQKRTTVSLYNY